MFTISVVADRSSVKKLQIPSGSQPKAHAQAETPSAVCMEIAPSGVRMEASFPTSVHSLHTMIHHHPTLVLPKQIPWEAERLWKTSDRMEDGAEPFGHDLMMKSNHVGQPATDPDHGRPRPPGVVFSKQRTPILRS